MLACAVALVATMLSAARGAKRAAAVVTDEYSYTYSGDEESESETAPVARGGRSKATPQRPAASERRAGSVPGASKKLAATGRSTELAPVARGGGEKNSSQGAAASERSARGASQRPAASERRTGETTGSRSTGALPDDLVEALTDRVQGTGGEEGTGKRNRKRKVAPSHDDLYVQRVGRLSETFAQKLPERKSELLLAAALVRRVDRFCDGLAQSAPAHQI